VVKVIDAPKFRQAAERDGEGDAVGNRPDEMAAMVKKDIERYAVLMKAAGIVPE
jgi:tripartite-type tricarboxylate transporter receptor subunit TctC